MTPNPTPSLSLSPSLPVMCFLRLPSPYRFCCFSLFFNRDNWNSEAYLWHHAVISCMSLCKVDTQGQIAIWGHDLFPQSLKYKAHVPPPPPPPPPCLSLSVSLSFSVSVLISLSFPLSHPLSLCLIGCGCGRSRAYVRRHSDVHACFSKQSACLLDHLLLLRSTTLPFISSVKFRPQNQSFYSGPLPSSWGWSPVQHHAAMSNDVSLHILVRTEDWGLVSLSALTQGKVRHGNPFQKGIQICARAQAENNGQCGPLLSPDQVKVCLEATSVLLPVTCEPRVKECAFLLVRELIAERGCRALQASLQGFLLCQTGMSKHPLKGHWVLSYQSGKRRLQVLDHLVWDSLVEDLHGW